MKRRILVSANSQTVKIEGKKTLSRKDKVAHLKRLLSYAFDELEALDDDLFEHLDLGSLHSELDQAVRNISNEIDL